MLYANIDFTYNEMMRLSLTLKEIRKSQLDKTQIGT